MVTQNFKKNWILQGSPGLTRVPESKSSMRKVLPPSWGGEAVRGQVLRWFHGLPISKHPQSFRPIARDSKSIHTPDHEGPPPS